MLFKNLLLFPQKISVYKKKFLALNSIERIFAERKKMAHSQFGELYKIDTYDIRITVFF